MLKHCLSEVGGWCNAMIFALAEYAELCSNHSTQQLTEQQYKSGEKNKGIMPLSLIKVHAKYGTTTHSNIAT